MEAEYISFHEPPNFINDSDKTIMVDTLKIFHDNMPGCFVPLSLNRAIVT